MRRTAGAVPEGQDGVLGVATQRADEAVRERLPFEQADSREHGEVLVEPDLELISRNA